MSASIKRGKAVRGDLALWDGRSTSYTRSDASGGTITGVPIGDQVDVLQVYGSGTTRARSAIAAAIAQIGTSSATLAFAPGTWAIDANLTIPSNFACYIPRGCVFSVDSGKTLTFSGPVYADSPSFYTGSGTTVLSVDSVVGGQIWIAQTAAETSTGVTPSDKSKTAWPIDITRYGVVPNSPGAATANTTAMKALLDPTKVGPIGRLIFPPVTGADTYYFNGVIPVRDGICIDLMGCTADYTATATTADNNSGLFFALRDFSCENGTITTHVAMGASSSSGYAINIGARGADSSYSTVYDNLLSKPMGNIRIRDLRIITTNTGAGVAGTGAIQIIGGVQNLVIENVVMTSGNSNTAFGIVTEFGWATSPAGTGTTQTSNQRNVHISNVIVRDLSATYGIGVDLAGSYNALVENLYVFGGGAAFYSTPGESLYYLPWVNQDTTGCKRTLTMRNIVGQNLSTTGITVQGAQAAGGGYLSATITALGHPGDYRAQTDLTDFSLDGFALDGAGFPGNGYGIFSTAGFTDIRNGTIVGSFQNGIRLSDEATKFCIENVNVFACTQVGVSLGDGTAIWSPTRLKKGYLRNSYIAGNGTSSAGAYAGVSITASCDGIIIENCRGGFEVAYSGGAEATQAEFVNVASGGKGVICRSNHVGGAVGGTAFFNGATVNNGCRAYDNTGIIVNSGPWSDAQTSLFVITYSTSMTPSVAIDNEFTITASNGTAFAINAPTNATRLGQRITITIRNTFGALGVATWNAVYKMQAWTQPGAGASRSIDFRYDGTSWVEITRTSGDVTN